MLALSGSAGVVLLVLGGIFVVAAVAALVLRGRVTREPAPGEPPDPAPNDETHHRLADGTTLHVTIWTIPEQSRRSGFAALRLPQNEGWTQLMVGGTGGY